jgi:crotonobetainyl-CoA:carnitine CoA-transferase CaiB-like acyl-CoA transferase
MLAKEDVGETDGMSALPRRVLGQGFDLLAGTRVLDLTTSIAGPYATMLLADMGAEVVKVERPGTGDDTRGWGPPFLDGESLWYVSVNRNKRSITLDILSDAGRHVFDDLLRKSDVVILNQPPKTLKKLRLEPASLRAKKPDIIYVSITGFGLDGARADWTCYDLIAEGYSGIMDLTGDPGSSAQKIGAPAADMLAGQDAAYGALAALFDRARTGRGHDIEISLVESMTRFLTCRIVPFLGSDVPVTRSGGKDSVIAIYQTFETADEPITLALGNDAIWKRFWAALGRPEMIENPEYATNEGRRAHREHLVDEIQRILIERPRGHWLQFAASIRVPAGPINGVDQVVRDEALIARGLFYKLRDGGREVPQVGSGIHVDGRSNGARRAPPRLGADTDAVLRDVLGYREEDIARLRSQAAL